MWTCPQCKQKNRDDARYCIGCGRERGSAYPAGKGVSPWLPWLLLGLLGLALIILGLVLLLRDPQDPGAEPTPTPAPTASWEAQDARDDNIPSPVPIQVATPVPTAPYVGYLTESGQLSEQGLGQLRRVMEDVIAENVRTTWGAPEHLLSSEYRGYLLLSPKGEDAPFHNILILVYQNRVNIRIPAEGVDKTLEYYYPLRFEELWCSADGSMVLSSPVLPGGEVKANVPGHYFYYKGYGDLEALRRAMADPERSVYNVEEVWAP